MCVALYNSILPFSCFTTSGYFKATLSLSFGSAVILNSHVSDGFGEGSSTEPSMCTHPLGQLSLYLFCLLDMLQFGWPNINFQSPNRKAACPMKPLRGGSRLIKISLRGELLLLLLAMEDHTLYPSNFHLSVSSSRPAIPSTIVGNQSVT